jgi:hypothetical protein
MKLRYFFGCILTAGSLLVSPGLSLGRAGHGVWNHGFGGGHGFGGSPGGFSGRGFSLASSQSHGFSAGGFHGGKFQGRFADNLVLLSWLNDSGKDVIFVQDTQTNDVQKITSEPHKNHFRIVAVHPNANPKLFEAVISDGSEQGSVKFRFATPKVVVLAPAPM